MRRRCIAGLVLLPVLLGCSAGEPSKGFISTQLMDAYIPLSERQKLVFNRWGAAFTVAPNIAVTNDHNLNFIPREKLLARSRDYDLLFFRAESENTPEFAKARAGEKIVAYGQGSDNGLREAKGAVAAVDEYVPPRCQGCAAQRALVFQADAGGGFSGGPVVDAASGAVLGVTFGYLDRAGGRRMYAYDIDLVVGEMRRLLGTGAP